MIEKILEKINEDIRNTETEMRILQGYLSACQKHKKLIEEILQSKEND